MQAVKVIGIAAAVIGAGLLSAGLAAVGALAVAIKHASEDMRNRERWNDNDDESGHQEALFSWAAYQQGRMPELEYLHHVPNGGKRDKATATALKRQGVKAGVPDIVLPAVRAGYHGLYIELKAGKNTTTDNQKRWLEYLRQQGYYTAVCYGWQPAAELIERYLLHPEELTQEQETITMR